VGGLAEIDHLAVSAEALEAGAAAVAARLGLGDGGGGRQARMATWNRLWGLGAEYLEVIAIDPEAPAPGRPRWFDLDRFAGPPRLTTWILRCADLEAALARAPAAAGEVLDFARGDYRWRMAVPADGVLPFDGVFPALIEWQGPAHPAAALPETGLRLGAVEVSHPCAGALRAALAALVDDPRIAVREGPAGLRARIDGPGGAAWL
jgi:hypothetical protein